MIKKTLYLLILLTFLASCGEEKPKLEKITVMTEGDTRCWSEIQIENIEIVIEQVPEGTLVQRVEEAETKPNLIYIKSKEDMEKLSPRLLNVEDITSDGYDRAKFENRDYVEIEARHASAKGEHYVLPDYNANRDNVERAWLYRADVFEELGIEIPETMSELTEVCLKLKEHYEDSTPLAIRDGYYGLDLIAPAWKNDASISTYYDFEKGKWSYGLSENWAGNFISYWANMHKAGLVPENYFTMKSEEVDALIAENKAFIVPDYVWKIGVYREENNGQEWKIMPPPRADIETGQHKIAKREGPFVGVAIYNCDEDTNELAIRVVDEYFLHSCGKEKEVNNLVRLARVYTEDKINPTRYVDVPEGEDEIRLKIHLQGMLTPFLKGEIPMARWADFAAQIEVKGAKEMMALNKSAYSNAKK